MKTHDNQEILQLSNPRLLSAVYFSLLAIVFTIFIDNLLYWLGVEDLIPLFSAILLAVVVAAVFGALFGRRIVHSKNPYRKQAFWNAVLMVILGLPFYTLGFVYFLQEFHASIFNNASFNSLISIYFIALMYIFFIVGIWFAFLAGVAAIFLRGYVVNLLLESIYRKRHVVNVRPTPKTTNKNKP